MCVSHKPFIAFSQAPRVQSRSTSATFPHMHLRLAILLLCTLFSRSLLGDVVELPKLVQNGIPQAQLMGESSANLIFRLIVPSGAEYLDVDTSGGVGDADLFVRFGVHPTLDNFDKSSEGFTNKEHVHINNPKTGVHYIMIYAARIFDGLTLTARYKRRADADNVPKLLPGPGYYAGPATIILKTHLLGGVVRYTTNGTDPTASSPAAVGPLVLKADTDLRVQTYLKTTPRGPVLDAPYFVGDPQVAIRLENGVPLEHRAGMIGSEALYKITVPAGMQRLKILTRGGSGDTVLYVRQGKAPTLTNYDQKIAAPLNRGDLSIHNPEAGPYYILIRGRGNYSGLILQASYRTLGADLVVWAPTLQPYQTTETFTANDCEVDEGMISAGTHRLLRFSTESRNLGGSNLVIGAPEGRDHFQFFECHGHYHFLGFASYLLRYKNGTPASAGRKVSFCLEDVERWDTEARVRSKFSCDFQGIQAGWSDIYDSGLPGQWIDVTGLPVGDYDLEVTINPDHFLEEADYSNNTSIIPVTLTNN